MFDMKESMKLYKYLFKEQLTDDEAKELGYMYHKLMKDMMNSANTFGKTNEELNKNTNT